MLKSLNTKPLLSKRKLYWVSQVVGWTLYIVIITIFNEIEGFRWTFEFGLNLAVIFVLGLVLTHLFRELILKLDWLKFKMLALIPRLLGVSFILSLNFVIAQRSILFLIIDDFEFGFEFQELLGILISVWAVFMFWTLLYFLFHFIQNYRKEEIKNLKWQAMKNEVELNKLKSQLNPHFIFNSMNIIRALIVEDPIIAKASITRLSNILRSSMLMGRKKVILFSEELQLVHDYLNLEKTRFEERLDLSFDVKENCKNHQIPPMILQTLVENGIKHGVSRLPEGGIVHVEAKLINGDLNLNITNSGKYEEVTNSEEVGFGLINTRQRLQLLYGSRAKFEIRNIENNKVLSKLIIPSELNKTHIEDESISN
jgi:sensor histidine kinase YesM